MTKTCCHTESIVAAIVVVLLAVFLFYALVFRKVFEGYRKNSADLVKGVTDATNKEIK